MPKTVIQYVLGRLKDIGIDDIFAVAGDFAFPIHDAIVQDPDISYIGCCNELNAGYAADGYARIRGVGAVSTTYGVGELSAISAVGGSYAENVPIFHLVGMPATAAQHKRELVHHTLGNGEFEFFVKMARLDPPRSNADSIRAVTEAIVSALDDAGTACISRVKRRERDTSLQPPSLGPVTGRGGDAITAEALYPRWAGFVRPGDIVVTETGTSSMGLAFAPMPKGATFHNQTLWGAIGWATPAAFGAAVAAPDRRVVLITGEGSHQLTAQEISQMGRRGLKPVVFVLNNSGYLIERLLGKDPNIVYNDLAAWHYAELPHALGCDGWFTARVTTCDELDEALKQASENRAGCYIEVVTGEYEAPPLPQKMHDSIATLYA